MMNLKHEVMMMNYSFREWKSELMGNDVKAMSVLSFPAIQLLDISVKDLISNSRTQAKAMLEIGYLLPDQAALVSLMDLSLEAEAFGCAIQCSDDEVPTVRGQLVHNLDEAKQLKIPSIRDGRCLTYVNAIEEVVQEQKDRPVFAGVIGPFSLAGRLMDVSEIMMECLMNPEYANTVLEKTTTFLKAYIRAYKEAGANGILMAEPLAGLLSPDMVKEFSSKYIKEICDELQDDQFTIIYHNCGPSSVQSIPEILSTTCLAYHFGNAVSLLDILKQMPSDTLVLGNIDPVKYFRNGTVKEMDEAVQKLLDECASYPNFIASSGCDIPPLANWDNIRQFYKSIESFNQRRNA